MYICQKPIWAPAGTVNSSSVVLDFVKVCDTVVDNEAVTVPETYVADADKLASAPTVMSCELSTPTLAVTVFFTSLQLGQMFCSWIRTHSARVLLKTLEQSLVTPWVLTAGQLGTRWLEQMVGVVVGFGVGVAAGAVVGDAVGSIADPCNVTSESVHPVPQYKLHGLVPIGGEELWLE